jgi:hypothetical protein
MMKLSPADYAALIAVSHRTLRDLREAADEGAKYVESLRRNGGPPDAGYLSRREDQRKRRLEAAMEELRALLSPAGWSALNSYV